MKTKLEMAHEWAIELLRSGYHGDDIISCAWQYADAMQAEADKRLSEATCKEKWQPDWSQAPELANWWSIDENGTANFSGKKPNIEGKQWVYYSAPSESPCHIEAPSFNYKGDWRDSLRKRPN